MDLGNIIYIIAIIAYFIYQVTKGKKKPQDLDGNEANIPEESESPVTFEDLLKEIRGDQRGKSKPEPEPQVKFDSKPEPQPRFPSQQKEKFESDDSEKKHISSYRPLEEQDDEIRTYRGAFESMDPKKAKASEGIPDIPSASSERISKRKSKNRVNPYANLVKKKDSLRKAIVLKEILDRKHF